MADPFGQLRERMAALADLRNVAQLLDWDQQTMMPPHGAPARAETVGTVQRISHEMFVSDQTGRLLDTAEAELDGAAPDSDEASLVRVVKRRWEKARRVPTELAAELARAASVGQQAWIAFRAESDFAGFAPYLERNVELVRRYIDCFDDLDCAYDALLDDFEPDAKTADVARVLSELRAELVPLVQAIMQSSRKAPVEILQREYPAAAQEAFGKAAAAAIGFDFTRGRLDITHHPFCRSHGPR